MAKLASVHTHTHTHTAPGHVGVAAGFKVAVLTVDGTIEVQLPCNLDDDMNIVIENKGVPYAEGRGIHHVSLSQHHALATLTHNLRSSAMHVN